jgi:uridine kinase
MDDTKKVTWEELYEMEVVKKARAWNRARDVETIEGINRRLRHGGFDGVIRDADRAYDTAIWRTAGEIMKHRESVRLVIVAGPSSSGKTTTSIKLCEALKTMGEKLQLIALDNYFWNLKDQPKDELGDYNFETSNALDKKTINRNISDLIAGRAATIPTYNFKTGMREEGGVKIQLAEGELLVIEGLHGFHKDMTVGVAKEMQFRVYIEAICQLKDHRGNFVPWTDIRLMRRMVRDNLHRNYTPLQTLGHWHYVRAAEKEDIVPFIKDANVLINGYLPYELPVHKKYLYPILKESVEHFEEMRGRKDAYRRGKRCLGYLEEVDVLEDDSIIPPTSLLREFIGGSIYA